MNLTYLDAMIEFKERDPEGFEEYFENRFEKLYSPKKEYSLGFEKQSVDSVGFEKQSVDSVGFHVFLDSKGIVSYR